MINSVLTPTLLWQDYDPAALPLRTSFVKYDGLGDGAFGFGAYFDAVEAEDGAVRVYACGKLRPSSDKTIVFVGEPWDKSVPRQFEELIASIPAGIVYADYAAQGADGGATSYPMSLDYGEYRDGNAHFDRADPTAADSCQFLWTKVIRRTITFVKSVLPHTSIVLVGAGIGADMVWQCAGTDARVDAIVPICNAGWREYRNVFRYGGSDALEEELSDLPDEITDERNRWLMGCAAQSYAKFVKCPCLYVGGTNNTVTDIDRVEATLSLLPDGRAFKTFYPNCSTILPLSWLTTLGKFIKSIGSAEGFCYASPEAELVQRDGYVGANISFKCDDPDVKLTLHYAYNEYDPSLRSWHPTEVGKGTARCVVPMADYADCVFCFVTAEYPDGVALSSYVTFLRADDETVKEPVRRSHIVYERKTGLGEFWADNPSDYLTGEKPVLKEGPFDIPGISCGNADLVTYAVGEDKYSREDNSFLQFDAAAEQDRELEVDVVSKEGTVATTYRTVCHLKGGEWTKCSLSPSMFKTDELKPLRDWAGVKRLTFVKMNGCIVKNILWV